MLSPPLLSSLNEVSKNIINRIASIFQAGIDEGIYKELNPMALADILMSLFMGLIVWEDAKRRLNPKKDFLKPTLKLAHEIIEKAVQKERSVKRQKTS